MMVDGKVVNADVAKGAGLTLLLLLLPASILAPVPGMYYHLKRGRLTGMIGSLLGFLAFFALALLNGGLLPQDYLQLAAMIAIALLMPELLLRSITTDRVVALTISAAAVVMLAGALIYAVAGINVHAEIAKEIAGAKDAVMKLLGQQPQPDQLLTQTKERVEEMAAMQVALYPAFMVVGLFLTAGLSLLVLRAFSARLPRLPAMRGFSWFKLPDHFIWGLIGGGFGWLAGNYFSLPLLVSVAQNVLVVVLFLYLVQGLAVAAHFMDRLKIGVFFRIIFYLLLLITGVAVAMGVFDLWGNFRAPRQSDGENL